MSLTPHKLTVGQAVFVRFWLGLTKLAMGSPDHLTEEYVRTYGVGGFLKWAGAIAKTLDRLEKRYGAVEAQMIVGLAALWTGCRWCGVGHMYSANLILFKKEQTLGPIDELYVPQLQDLKDPEVLVELERRLEGDRWVAMRAVMRRQYELHAGTIEVLDEDDELLMHANHMWEWVTECSIVAMDYVPETITPRSGIGRDRALIKRYREARRQKALDAGS